MLALHDLLSLEGIRRFNRLEASVNGRWSAIEDGVTAHRVQQPPTDSNDFAIEGMAVGSLHPHLLSSGIFLKS